MAAIFFSKVCHLVAHATTETGLCFKPLNKRKPFTKFNGPLNIIIMHMTFLKFEYTLKAGNCFKYQLLSDINFSRFYF